jgi:hypothetical protein
MRGDLRFHSNRLPAEWALAPLSAFIRDNRQLSTAIGDSPLADERGHFPHPEPILGIPVASERLNRTQEVDGSNPPSSIGFRCKYAVFGGFVGSYLGK